MKEIMSFSQDPATNSKITNSNIHKSFGKLEQVFFFYTLYVI